MSGPRRLQIAFLVVSGGVVVVIGAALALYLIAGSPGLSGKAPLVEIQSVDTLRSQFNQDAGKIRLILFLSPTSPVCLAGTRWLQLDILGQQPTDSLRVYAVWMPMLPGDSRDSWDGGYLSDYRVLHYWDEGRLTGTWFAQEVDGLEGVSWNTYYLFEPHASWESVPSPPQDSGGTIRDRAMILRAHLLYLIWELTGNPT